MAATIKIDKTCGASGYETSTEVTDVKLKNIDDATTLAANSPVEIPAAGTNYSYESWLRFKCTVVPANQCNTFRIWSDGAIVATGVTISINTNQVDTYATPVKTLSTKGVRDNFKNRSSISKVSITGTLTGEGDKTNFSVFQLEVGATATPGDVSDIASYSYDES